MGRRLDTLLGRKFKTGKFKTIVSLAVSRLSVLKNHRQARLAIARSDVTQLLTLNHHEHALLRVDQVMKEMNMLDVFVMIDGYCHLLLQRLNLIEEEKSCPDELKEAVSSLLFAAPRCGEFPEIQEIRAILTARYGKEFACGAIELRNNCGVSPKMIQKLSSRQSSLEIRMKILTEIASVNGVVLQLEDPSPSINEVEQKQNQRTLEADSTILPDEVEKVLSFSESMNGRKKYRDVADAAQAAFESAAYAAAAARAAVELSRSDNPDSPNSRPRKVLDSKPMKIEKIHEFESKFEHEEIHAENKGEGSKSNKNATDSDGCMPLEKTIVFDESDNEGEERMDFSSFGHEGGLKTDFGQKVETIQISKMQQEVQQLDLKKRPISVRTKRVYGR